MTFEAPLVARVTRTSQMRAGVTNEPPCGEAQVGQCEKLPDEFFDFYYVEFASLAEFYEFVIRYAPTRFTAEKGVGDQYDPRPDMSIEIVDALR